MGYSWFATQDYYEPYYDFNFELQPDQFYQFDGYVSREYRKGLNAVRYIRSMQNHFLAQGYKEAIAAVDLSNARNLNFHIYMGFRETGKMLLTRFIFKKPHTRLVLYNQLRLKNQRFKSMLSC